MREMLLKKNKCS